MSDHQMLHLPICCRPPIVTRQKGIADGNIVEFGAVVVVPRAADDVLPGVDCH